MAEAAPMDDDHMVEILSPIFPHLSNRVLQMSIQHPENRQEPLNRDFLLQRCIDDLLELRTLKQTRIDGTLPGEEGHGDPGLEGLNDSALFEQGRNGTHNHDNATSTGQQRDVQMTSTPQATRPAEHMPGLTPIARSQTDMSPVPRLHIMTKQEPASLARAAPDDDVILIDTSNSFITGQDNLPRISPKRRWHLAQDENENVSKKRKATDVAPEEDGGADAGNTEGVVSRELSEQEVLEGQVEAVRQLFPLADPAYILQSLKSTMHSNRVGIVCNQLLENPKYPRLQKTKTMTPSTNGTEGDKKCNYYEEFSEPVSFDYQMQALQLLQSNFRKVSVKDLRVVAKFFAYHYAPTHKCIYDALLASDVDFNKKDKTEVKDGDKLSMDVAGLEVSLVVPSSTVTVPVTLKTGSKELVRDIKLLKCGRNKVHNNLGKMVAGLRDEVQFMVNCAKAENQEKDSLLAEMINETEYSDTGQLIECGCCYGDHSFEKMVQCYEGHLFCCECLRNYAKEAIYGQGKSSLNCMTDECEATFPKGQIIRALSKEMMAKYEERVREEDLNLADIDGLVRCPNCDFAAVLPPEDKVFSCQNPSCLKETCRHCKEEWEEHFGIPCSELEKGSETKIRLAYEEKMTLAKIRNCHKCKASFTKSEGCNKMTCRCGAKMCYICRKPNIDYNHFCKHARNPGKLCVVCKDCSLWTNPDEDEERAIAEIKKEAQAERAAKGYTEDKEIGAPKQKSPQGHQEANQAAPRVHLAAPPVHQAAPGAHQAAPGAHQAVPRAHQPGYPIHVNNNLWNANRHEPHQYANRHQPHQYANRHQPHQYANRYQPHQYANRYQQNIQYDQPNNLWERGPYHPQNHMVQQNLQNFPGNFQNNQNPQFQQNRQMNYGWFPPNDQQEHGYYN